MKQTDKILIRQTEFKNLDKILTFESNNSQFVQQYSLKEHIDILENECHLSIFEKEYGNLIGYVILIGISNKNIEFRRIVISKKGLGFGKDALKLIKEICFDDFNANKIWLDVYTDNTRAIKLYESQGFLKESKVLDKNQRDLWIMSINNESETN